jgi:hypothetical protein
MDTFRKTVLFGGIILLLAACNSSGEQDDSDTSTGSPSARQEQALDLDAFTGIRLYLPANVSLTPGKNREVRIQAPKEVLDDLITEVHDGVWTISTRNRLNSFSDWFHGEDDIKLFITAPLIYRVELSSSGSVHTTAPFETKGTVVLEVSGSGDIDYQGRSETLLCTVSGSGNIRVRGQAPVLDANISGSGSMELLDLNAEKAEVDISGSGDCKVNATETLDVEISGSGEVRYKGEPRLRSKIWGSGDVLPL